MSAHSYPFKLLVESGLVEALGLQPNPIVIGETNWLASYLQVVLVTSGPVQAVGFGVSVLLYKPAWLLPVLLFRNIPLHAHRTSVSEQLHVVRALRVVRIQLALLSCIFAQKDFCVHLSLRTSSHSGWNVHAACNDQQFWDSSTGQCFSK
jgi:hypothetical protein